MTSWFNGELRRLKIKRRKLERKMRNSNYIYDIIIKIIILIDCVMLFYSCHLAKTLKLCILFIEEATS